MSCEFKTPIFLYRQGLHSAPEKVNYPRDKELPSSRTLSETTQASLGKPELDFKSCKLKHKGNRIANVAKMNL